MQLDAVTRAVQAYYNVRTAEQDEEAAVAYEKVSEEVKKEFDKKYKGVWHCIVGENFGSFVTHESKNFIFFEIDEKSVLLFKSA